MDCYCRANSGVDCNPGTPCTATSQGRLTCRQNSFYPLPPHVGMHISPCHMTPPKLQWIERARYDLETVRGMVRTCKYLYAAFMCQQCVEKILKAIVLSNGTIPPPIHNLLKLSEGAELLEECEKFDEGLLAELTPYCIKARYGEYKRKLSELCDRKTSVQLVRRTERMHQWLLKKIGR